QKGVNRFELFAHESERDVVETSAAVLLRNADSQKVKLGHLLQYRRVKLLLFIPFLDVRRNFLLRKLAHCLHEGLVIFGQFKIDHLITLSSSVLKMTGHLTQVETRMSKPQYPQITQ